MPRGWKPRRTIAPPPRAAPPPGAVQRGREEQELRDWAEGLWQRELKRKKARSRATKGMPARRGRERRGTSGEEVAKWADLPERARSVIQSTVQSLPASVGYGLLGYEPFGEAHGPHVQLGLRGLPFYLPSVLGHEYTDLERERQARRRERGLETQLGEGVGPTIPLRLLRRYRSQLAENLPWSAEGRRALTAPWLPQIPKFPVGGRYAAIEGLGGFVQAQPRWGFPEHEYGHAATTGWPEERFLEFRNTVFDWLGNKSAAEMTPTERYIFELVMTDTVPEAYAQLARFPQAIPPELESFFPQYDLTRRRAMGVPQRLGYAGPALTDFGVGIPPRPPTVGYGPGTTR